jgi:hypothetical protein
MFKSSEAVNGFQKSFARDQAAISAQSKALNNDFKNSSTEISKASKISSDSISDISTNAKASIAGVKEFSRGIEAAGAEMKKAIGPEAAAHVKETTAKVEEFVATRIAIAAVGLALGAVAATAVGVGVAVYKATGFLKGLITGESYKSANIDALIATNDKVIDLQKSMQLAAVDANAMNDAINRLGINKSDVTTVYGNATNKLRGGDKSELDRLGVDYKGKETTQVIENAKKVLDEYTEGWDRNQAAVALGFGTYEQINNYLKLNQEELSRSKDRLDEYGLGIGPETQEAVRRYQSAMLIFNNETRLMSEGAKRVIADTVMPILTNFATYLQDGWPAAVNFFRGVAASAAYIAIKGTIASLTAFVDVTEGIVLAIGKLATGDVKGAQDALAKGWNNAGKTMADAGDKMVEHARNTTKALALAWAFDDRTNPLGEKGPKGKTFEPPPKVPDAAKPYLAGLTDEQKEAQRQIKEWLKTVWDKAATELAAEDFSKDINKKLGLMTPKDTGFTKNPAMNTGTDIKLKSDIELEEERKIKAQQLELERKFQTDLNNIKMSAAEQASGLAWQIAGENRALQLAALVFEKSVAIARIMMNTEIAASAAMISAAAIPGGAAIGAAQAAAIRAMSYVSIGMVVASGLVEGMNIAGKRELGGPVSAGKTYLVGEKGPELFTPGSDGGITPNHKLGGVTYSPVYQIDARHSRLNESEIKSIVELADKKTYSRVLNSMNRGGEMALASGRMK